MNGELEANSLALIEEIFRAHTIEIRPAFGVFLLKHPHEDDPTCQAQAFLEIMGFQPETLSAGKYEIIPYGSEDRMGVTVKRIGP